MRDRFRFLKAPFYRQRPSFYLGLFIFAVASLAICAVRTQSPAHSLAFARSSSGSFQPLADSGPSADQKPKAAASGTAGNSAKPAASAAAAVPANDKTAAPAVPADVPACGLDLDALIKQYTADIESAKDDLDKKLSFPTGVNISSQYVDSYNKAIAGLYDQYDKKADSAGCSFQPARPQPLPADYLGQ